MADDRPHLDFDLDTDEGLEAYVLDLKSRSQVPEQLRYPETTEAYRAAVREGTDELDRGLFISSERMRAWIESWDTDGELPPPEPECA